MTKIIKKFIGPTVAGAIMMTGCSNQPEISKVPEVKTKKHKSECDLVVKNGQSDTIAKLEALGVTKEKCPAYNKFAKDNFKKVMNNESTEEMAVKLAFHSDKKGEVKISDENLSKIEDEFQCDTKKYKGLSVYDNNLANIYNCSAEIRKKYSGFFESNANQKEMEIKEGKLSSDEYSIAYSNYYLKTNNGINDFNNLSVSEQRKYLKEDDNTKKKREIVIKQNNNSLSSGNISLDD